MEDKVVGFEEAIQLVKDGSTLAIGGSTIYRRPVAFVRSLIQQANPPRNLTLLAFTAGYESDLLVGAGLVHTVRTCYFGLEIFGLAPMFTEKAAELNIMEESEASLAHGIRAHLAGVSFMPGLGWLGTDLPKLRPDVRIIEDPYNPGQQVVAFPAISWDVAVIHAVRADPSGNALLNGNIGIDRELASGAKHVVITAEEIVEGFDGQVNISGLVVDVVVHAPLGAWPTSCYPVYPLAGGELLRYIEMCNAGEFEAYLETLALPQSNPA